MRVREKLIRESFIPFGLVGAALIFFVACNKSYEEKEKCLNEKIQSAQGNVKADDPSTWGGVSEESVNHYADECGMTDDEKKRALEGKTFTGENTNVTSREFMYHLQC